MNNVEVAKEVIAGKWGNGDERRRRLYEAGYDANAVQTIVNALLSDAQQKTEEKYLTVDVDLSKYNGLILKFK